MLVCCKRGEGRCSSLLLFSSYCNTCSGGKEELRRKIEDILDCCYCLFSLFYFRSASKKSLLTPPASYLPLIHSIDWRKLIRLGDFQVDFNFPDPEERSQILWEHITGGKGPSSLKEIPPPQHSPMPESVHDFCMDHPLSTILPSLPSLLL